MAHSEDDELRRPSGIKDPPGPRHPLDELVAQHSRRWALTGPYSERRRKPGYIHWAYERQSAE